MCGIILIEQKEGENLEIRDRIKATRKQLGMSQAEFGKRLGVSRDSINDIENDRLKKPEQKEPLYRLICAEFDVSEQWLRTGEGEMFVQLSRDEEIAAFVGKALSDETDTFKKRLIAALAQLDEPEWELLEKMVVKIAETEKDQA